MNSGHSITSPLQLHLLGTFELLRAGAPVRLPKKAQALLAILALSPKPVAKETLATLLWGHTGPAQAKASLRQCLVSLRSALAEHAMCIVADGAAIALTGTEAFETDSGELLRLKESDRLQDLQRANSLFRDTLLSGLDIPIEPFERWITIERQRFDALRLDLLQRLAKGFAAG